MNSRLQTAIPQVTEETLITFFKTSMMEAIEMWQLKDSTDIMPSQDPLTTFLCAKMHIEINQKKTAIDNLLNDMWSSSECQSML